MYTWLNTYRLLVHDSIQPIREYGEMLGIYDVHTTQAIAKLKECCNNGALLAVKLMALITHVK